MPFQAKKKRRRKEWATNNETIVWASKHRERGRKRRNKRAYGEEDEDDVVVDGVCLYIHVPPPLLYVCQYNSPSLHPSIHPPTIAAGYILFAPAEKGGYYVAVPFV